MPDLAKLVPPIAPKREAPGSGHTGFDRVSQLALGLPHTADAVIAMTALALKAQSAIDDAEKRREWESEHKIEPFGSKNLEAEPPAPQPSTIVDKPKPSHPAPVAGARRNLVPKKEPNT